jgi:post-segregation antitoxin (ccd killing protein)
MSRVIFSDGKAYPQTTVYLKSDIYELAKSSGINVTRLFQHILDEYFDLLREDRKREATVEELVRQVKERRESGRRKKWFRM